MDDYDRFREWVVKRGRDEGTADLYERHLRAAFGHPKGWRGRLNDRGLAPKTRHVCKSSLRAWAYWKDDKVLERDIRDIKLPANQRAKAKRPLEQKDWESLLEAIGDTDLDEPTRAVLGLMAVRGFRVGDLLRMTSKEVHAAVTQGVVAYQAKGGRRLEFGVLTRMKSYLQTLDETEEWAVVADLISPRSKPPNRFKAARQRIYMVLRRVAGEAGLDPSEVHPHRLRRTVAVYFLRKVNGDLTKLKQFFQWATLEVAAGYVDHDQRAELDEVGETLI